MIFEYFKVVLMILYLIMFGRFLASVGRISAPNFKPVFNNFPKQPLSVQKMYFWLTKAMRVTAWAFGSCPQQLPNPKPLGVFVEVRERLGNQMRDQQSQPDFPLVPGYINMHTSTRPQCTCSYFSSLLMT